MSRLEVEARTDESGSMRIRLPGPPASYKVRVTVEWDPAEADEAARRRDLFGEIRRSGSAQAKALLQKLGEDAILNPHALLCTGALADDPISRPPQPPLETRSDL